MKNKKIIIAIISIIVISIGLVCYFMNTNGVKFSLGKDYERIESEGLVVYYSQGYEALAKEHQIRLSSMGKFYNRKYDFKEEIAVYVLDKDDFTKEFKDASSYGMPFTIPKAYTDGKSIIVCPATDDGIVTMASLAYIDNISERANEYFAKAGFTPEEAIKKYTHLVAAHEFGHVVIESMELSNKGHWFNETLADFCTIQYLEENEPDLVNIWYGNLYVMEDIKPKFTGIESFDKEYSSLDTENYVWYQNQFSLTAKEIYEDSGEDFLIKAKKILGSEEMDSAEELIEKLSTVSPVLKERWLK